MNTRNLNSPMPTRSISRHRTPSRSPPVKPYIRSNMAELAQSISKGDKNAIVEIDQDAEIESSYSEIDEYQLNVSVLKYENDIM